MGDIAMGACAAAGSYYSYFAAVLDLLGEAGVSLSNAVAGGAMIGGGLAFSSGSPYPWTLGVVADWG